jgi:hypothetical protein
MDALKQVYERIGPDVTIHVLRVLQTVPITKTALSKIWEEGPSGLQIKVLLHQTCTFEATDARDKIYSLLGLAHKDDRAAFHPDCSRSVLQVYTEVAEYILQDDMNNLCFNTNSLAYKLPSWVPDWSLSKQQLRLWMPGLYNAASKSQANVKTSPGSCLLKVSGILLDEINYLTQQVALAPPNPQNLIKQKYQK